MSSHHIIRENQESALFLVDSKAVKRELLESYFEWSPLIVTTEETFIQLNQFGYKIDALICERGFKINFETELAIQHPIDIITAGSSNQVIKEGINYLINKKAPAINIFLNTSVEKMMEISHAFPKQKIVFVNQNKKVFVADEGKYEKWLPENIEISIIPTVESQEFYLGQNEKLILNEEHLIKIKKEGPFTLSSYQKFMVSENE